MKHLLSVLALLVATSHAAATDDHPGLTLEPALACELMADQGLRTRGFRADSESLACRSQRRSLSGGGQPRHTIRYRVLGSSGMVESLVLELQINSNRAVQRAHRQLSDHTQILFERVVEQDLPVEIETAILAAEPGSWSINGNHARLERITAGTPHYELRLSIE